jgi:hypothetical protein
LRGNCGKDGINIKTTLDFLLPFYHDKKRPYEQITPVETTYERLIPLLKQAAKVYRQELYHEMLKRMTVNLAAERATLLCAD